MINNIQIIMFVWKLKKSPNTVNRCLKLDAVIMERNTDERNLNKGSTTLQGIAISRRCGMRNGLEYFVKTDEILKAAFKANFFDGHIAFRQ